MIYDLKPYPSYKDSALSWVGIIPSHWDEKRAKYLFREVDERSKTGKEELLSVSHITGVTPRSQKNVTMFMAESTVGHKICRPGDLVINTLWAWMGALGVSPLIGLVSPAYGVYRPSKTASLSSAFIGHLLRSPQYVSEYTCRSTGIQSSRLRLYPEQLLEIPIVRPPVDEQWMMLRYLAYVDRRVRRYIAVKRKLIALLGEQKQVIVHRAVTRGLDPNARLKPSGVEWLGDVPEHWAVLSLGAASLSIQTGPFGSQLHANEYLIGGVPVINPSHMLDGLICPDPRIAVSGAKATELQRHRLQDHDVVAARRGELGRSALVTKEQEGWLCGTGSLRIRPRREVFESSYLVQLLGSSSVRDLLKLSSIGATMDNLNASMVARLSLPAPPLQEQKAIIAWMSGCSTGIDSAIVKARREIDLLREYRTRLIADVVTGKLDVREAAAHLPDEADASEPLDEADALTEDDDADPDATSEEAEG